MKHIIFAVLIFGSLNSFAGGRVGNGGNGGDGVVCRNPDKTIKSAELLDYYEARTLRGIHADLGNSGNFQQRIEFVLKRLERLDSERAQGYLKAAQNFMSEVLFQPGIVLTDIPDSDHMSLPVGCAIEQVIIQQEVKFPEDKRFLVSQDLWNAFDESNKAGIVLHEMIYAEALKLGHRNSIHTRYYNSIISSKRIESEMTPQEMHDVLKSVGFPTWSHYGFLFDVGSVKFYPNGDVESGQLSYRGKARYIDWKNQKFEVRHVYFFEDGKLRGFNFIDSRIIHVPSKSGRIFALNCRNLIELWPNGEFAGRCGLEGEVRNGEVEKANIYISVQGQRLKISKVFGMWDDGSPRFFHSEETLNLELANHTRATFSPYNMEIDKSELVLFGFSQNNVDVTLLNGEKRVATAGNIRLFSNARLARGNIDLYDKWPDGSAQPAKLSGYTEFWENGKIKKASPKSYLKWAINNRNVVLIGSLRFHQNGKLARGQSPYPLTLEGHEGSRVWEVNKEFCLIEKNGKDISYGCEIIWKDYYD